MPFLGRKHELHRLTRGCEAAVQGRGGMHLLVGEPGIGKTRLAEEIAAIAASRGMTVAWGRAWETGGAPSFHPWTEVLETLGGVASGAPSLDESR
ncbi:MAG TPA: AAA family ATPase, partial [Polyangiaceae bacterium]